MFLIFFKKKKKVETERLVFLVVLAFDNIKHEPNMLLYSYIFKIYINKMLNIFKIS